MKNYFKEICSLFPIRRTKEQKSAFFDYVSGEFEPNRVKKDILEKEHENIVIGDIESAKVIFTAHYDTPATSLVPNLMLPANKFINYLYHLGYPLILALLSLAVAFGIGRLLSLELYYTVALYLVIYFVAFFAATRMVTNKNNVNDNSSGVATVISLAKQINKREVAFVLFDNEEKGLLGSKAMSKAYKDLLKDKTVINFDCVANGNEIIFIVKKGAEESEEYAILKNSLIAKEGFNLHFLPFKGSASNSDYKNFERGIGVMACTKGKFVKFYTDKIHTNKDTVGREENVSYIVEQMLNFVSELK